MRLRLHILAHDQSIILVEGVHFLVICQIFNERVMEAATLIYIRINISWDNDTLVHIEIRYVECLVLLTKILTHITLLLIIRVLSINKHTLL